MKIIQIPLLRDNYGYLLVCDKTKKAAPRAIAVTVVVSLLTAYVLAHVTYLSIQFFGNSFLQDALTTAFWDAYLRDDPSAKSWFVGDGPRSLLEKGDKWQKK